MWRWAAAALLLAGCDSLLGEGAHVCPATGTYTESYLCPAGYACSPDPIYCGKPDPNVKICDSLGEHDACTTADGAAGVCLTARNLRTCTACTPDIAWCTYPGWSAMTLPSQYASIDLSAVWVLGRGDVYVGGALGTVLHYDGQTWSSVDIEPPLTNTVTSIWASGSADIFVDARAVARYDGNMWSQLPSATAIINGLSGIGTGDVIGVGQGTIQEFRVSSNAWQVLDAPSAFLDAVWAVGGSTPTVFAAGNKGPTEGFLEVCQSGTCGAPQQTSVGLYGLWGSDPNNVFAVGPAAQGVPASTVLQYMNGAWSSMTVLGSGVTQSALNAIWGEGPKQVFAVGQNGTLIFYDGQTWTAWTTSDMSTSGRPIGNPTLTAISGDASDVFVVGAGGTVWRYSYVGGP